MEEIIKQLPEFVVSEKGTKFYLMMRYTAKGFAVSYRYPGRFIIRKGHSEFTDKDPVTALQKMLVFLKKFQP